MNKQLTRRERIGRFLPGGKTKAAQENDISEAWKLWLEHIKKTFRKADWLWSFFEDGEVRIECFVGDSAYMEELSTGGGNWTVEGPLEQAIEAAIRKSQEFLS